MAKIATRKQLAKFLERVRQLPIPFSRKLQLWYSLFAEKDARSGMTYIKEGAETDRNRIRNMLKSRTGRALLKAFSPQKHNEAILEMEMTAQGPYKPTFDAALLAALARYWAKTMGAATPEQAMRDWKLHFRTKIGRNKCATGS